VEIVEGGDSTYCIPAELYQDHLDLREVLNLRRSGVRAGAIIKNELIPDHELVLSDYLSRQAPYLELDRTTALQYLRKESISLPQAPKGWYVAKFQGLALGLMKHLGNRVNNYYPASWRILKS
jgi:NOL1/NOP2/fmu family ribosome biogenesis protein